jgi:iron complex transport system substrate-binding protein
MNWLRWGLSALVLILLAACGAPAAQTPVPSAAPSSAPSTETTPEADAFPVTIEHKFGSTRIEQAPERVVSLGYTDHDPLLALGTTPVAVRYYFGDEENAIWSWARDEITGPAPQVLNMPFGELNFEAIAALDPDLIVGVSSGITDEEYATLSEIAPTVAQSDEYVDFGVPWQEQTQVIGRAVGQEARARDLVAATEERFAQVRAEHPAFENATAAIVAPAADGQFFVSGPQHERQRVLTSLGLQLPDELAELAGDAFFGTISGERIDLIDTDVLIVTATPEQQAALESDPIFQQLSAAQEDRVIFLDTSGTSDDLIGPALLFSSVLSLPVVFDELVPQLATALGGDTESAATTGALQVLEETDQYRVVKHALGEVQVPREPQRIIALQDQNMLLPLLELGVDNVVGSVGHTQAGGDRIFRRTADYDTSNVQYVGEYGEPNLEAIAALKPDLILGGQFDIDETNYDLLSQIAPTVVIEVFTRPVASVMDDLALLTNTQNAAADLKARYDSRIAEVKAALVDPSAITLSIITPYNAEFYFDASEYDNGVAVARDLGLQIPALHEQAIAQGDYPSYSLELLKEADGDALFILDYGTEGQASEYSVDNIRSSPLFGTLNAVQKDQAFVIDPSRMGGVSYGGLFGMIDAIEQHLTGKSLDTSWEPGS